MVTSDYLTPAEHRRMLHCRDHVLAALTAAAADRSDPNWIENERFVIAANANAWATANPPARTISVDQIERVEVLALGHVDYATKLALYVAEYVTNRREIA